MTTVPPNRANPESVSVVLVSSQHLIRFFLKLTEEALTKLCLTSLVLQAF